MSYHGPLEYLKSIKSQVFPIIKKYLPVNDPKKHYQIVADYPNRQGKYFRPGLLLLAAQMYGVKQKEAFLSAAAIQLSEDWLLIHDDVEDASEERRGKPTLNVLHGNELAINAGDALHVIMWRILGDNIKYFKDNRGYQIFNIFNNILLTTIEGQYMDLNWIHKNQVNISKSDYFDMITRKTCNYTTIAPLQIGAIVSGQSQKELNSIKAWAIPFGYAFQIWDDCMNLTSKKQGKELAGDILEGKRTLILSHLLNNCAKDDKQKIIQIYIKKRIQKTEKEKNYILNKMHVCGSITYAQNIAQDYSKSAIEIFNKNTTHLPDSIYKKHIKSLIEFVVNREK